MQELNLAPIKLNLRADTKQGGPPPRLWALVHTVWLRHSAVKQVTDHSVAQGGPEPSTTSSICEKRDKIGAKLRKSARRRACALGRA
jgi:hypothetical protein